MTVRSTLLVILIVFLSFLTACTGFPTQNAPGTNSVTQVGALRIAATTPQSLPADYYPSAKIENDGLVRPIELDRFAEGFTAEVTNLPIGDWELTVELHDPLGDLTHSAQETVRIYAGLDNFVQLQVQPVDATLEMVVDLKDFPERDDVQGVRVNFNGGSYFSLSSEEDDPYLFHGQRSVRAGDYEFSVALYGESFLVAERLYQSPWETARFHSGKSTQIHWTPAFGSTEVHVDIVNPPDIPGGIQCTRTPEELYVLWDPNTVPVDGSVRIYARFDEYRAFSLIGEEDASVGSWLISPKDEDSLKIVLTGVNAAGNESYRSDPIIPEEC